MKKKIDAQWLAVGVLALLTVCVFAGQSDTAKTSETKTIPLQTTAPCPTPTPSPPPEE